MGDKVEQAAEKLKQRGYKTIESKENINGDGMLRTRFQKELVIIELATEMNSQIIKRVSILTNYH